MVSFPTRIVPLVALLFLGTATVLRGDEVAEGRALYLRNCASCHGLMGEGDGPIARALSTPPANLRLLSDRYGSPLPEDQVARFIDGRAEIKAHGPRDMPVWGERFYIETGGNEREVKARIASLVAFLQSVQTGNRQALK